MIPTPRAPEPPSFDERVRKPGAAWLAGHPSGRPSDYWRRCSAELAAAFHDRCAYTAMLVTPGTVDHFVSIEEDRSLAYEWSNFRLAAGWVNSSKQNVSSGAILDPCEIEDGWFELILPSLQVVVTGLCPSHLRARAETTLTRLNLRDGETAVRIRRTWYELYQAGNLPLSGLDAVAPLLARAIRKQAEASLPQE